MDFSNLINNKDQSNSAFFRFLSSIVGILAFFIILNILAPTFVSVLLNFLWILLLIIVVIFFALGALVIFGMRKEVGHILDVLLEGSLSILDLIDLIKRIWSQFIDTLREFLVFSAPVYAYMVGTIIYILLLILYKTVGKTTDVTVLTIIITVVLVAFVGILNKPGETSVDMFNWRSRFRKSFKSAFADASEVIIFVFFLTMDSTKLFFLPADLNVELHAKILDYDLMTRSFVYSDHFQLTISIIIAAITVEIIRNVLKLVAVSRKYYVENLQSLEFRNKATKVELVKRSIRQGFADSKDDVVKFITFTTVLFGVFMFFPRLKLITLVLASFTSLVLDLIILSRLTSPRGNDLITRILSKVFKI